MAIMETRPTTATTTTTTTTSDKVRKRQNDMQQATSDGSHNSTAQRKQAARQAECSGNSVVVSLQWNQRECSGAAILKTSSKKAIINRRSHSKQEFHWRWQQHSEQYSHHRSKIKSI